MDYFLIGLGILLLIAGIMGCVLPALPGPPLSYLGLLALHFTEKYQFSLKFLIIWAVVVVVVSLVDYLVPVWGAKKFGASKRGIWGSIIGLLLGFFIFPPFGIIVGPFAGAVIGELTSGKKSGDAMYAGFGSFAGFMTGVLLKLIASGWMTWSFIKTALF
jgi:uncharacterized protein YqgC (DUF456 family)